MEMLEMIKNIAAPFAEVFFVYSNWSKAEKMKQADFIVVAPKNYIAHLN